MYVLICQYQWRKKTVTNFLFRPHHLATDFWERPSFTKLLSGVKTRLLRGLHVTLNPWFPNKTTQLFPCSSSLSRSCKITFNQLCLKAIQFPLGLWHASPGQDGRCWKLNSNSPGGVICHFAEHFLMCRALHWVPCIQDFIESTLQSPEIEMIVVFKDKETEA